MGRRKNELYLDMNTIDTAYRTVKHPGTIELYANVNVNKIADKPIDMIGVDIEVDGDTGEIMLIGFYDDEAYEPVTHDFLMYLIKYIKYAIKKQKALSYWTRFDPFNIIRLFMLTVPEEEARYNLSRIGKESGAWNSKTKSWDTPPIVEVQCGNQYVGISSMIHSNIQFYARTDTSERLKKVWAYDINALYQGNIETESGKRFDWYSKLGKEFHIVDWKRTAWDTEYYNGVLKSNELDARAARALAMSLQQEFYEAFGYYTRSLISHGALARAAIVAETMKYHLTHQSEADAKDSAYEELANAAITNHLDTWCKTYGEDVAKDFYAMMTEAYSGGMIEAFSYGYAEKGYYADLGMAYLETILRLEDLKGSTLEWGNGPPPPAKPHEMCLVRGTASIPRDLIHTITIKNPISPLTNIRPSGTFKAAYTREERNDAFKHGATFKDEFYYLVKTKGKMSPLARACKTFMDLRSKFIKEGNTSEFMAKIAANSEGGIIYEAIPLFQSTQEKTYEVVKSFFKNCSDALVTEHADGRLPKDQIERLSHQYIKSHKVFSNEKIAQDVLRAAKSTVANDPFMKEIKDALHCYVKKIDLTPLKTEIDYIYGNRAHFLRWHSPKGVAVDTVAQELFERGIDIRAEEDMETFMNLVDLYRNVQSDMKRPFEDMINPREKKDVLDTLKRRIDLFDQMYVIAKGGFRAGEFWNPLYATYITSTTRRRLAAAGRAIVKAGGELVFMMTDSILWTGSKGMLPEDMIKAIKTPGYFEPIEEVKHVACLGTGRYTFETEDKELVTKRRGLSHAEIHSRKGVGIQKEQLDWLKALSIMEEQNSTRIKLHVQTLISPGMVYSSRKYGVEDLGRIIQQTRSVEAVVGLNKRLLCGSIKDVKRLRREMIPTKAIHLVEGMYGDQAIPDGTYSKLRAGVMNKTYETREEKRNETEKKTSRTYYEKNKKDIKRIRKEKYAILSKMGIPAPDANRLCRLKTESIQKEVLGFAYTDKGGEA